MGSAGRALVFTILLSGCLGTRALAEDADPEPSAEEREWLELYDEKLRRFVAELPNASYCLAGNSCADRPEFQGPAACLASRELPHCDRRGRVELAK